MIVRLPGARLVVALGVAVLLLLLNGGIAYRSTRTLADYERQVAHTEETLGQIQGLLVALTDAETGQRGYLLLGDDAYLAPYTAAQAQIPARLDRVRALIADDLAQQARQARLEMLTAAKLDELRRTVELRQAGQGEAALALVRTGRGKGLMDEIRAIVTAMIADEDGWLAQRTAAANAARETTGKTLIAATIGEAALLAAIAALFWRNLRQRERTARERAALLMQEREARTTAEAAVALRDQFLGIASHELKNPLTVLQGSAQLLALRLGKRADLGERERRMLAMLGDQTARMRRLIDTMLDVSRIDSGRLAIERAPVDLVPLVGRIVREAALPFETPRVVLEGDEASLLVDGDELRLEQVVQNLLQNALRYSEDMSVVRVCVGREGQHASIAVTDEGAGIPAAAIPHLFERFFRAPNSAGQRGGMGVGLFVVREIVALHGGEIAVESVEGEGSTFTVYLDLPDQREGEAEGPRDGDTATEPVALHGTARHSA